MPAIDPTDLRARAAVIAQKFGEPDALRFALRLLLLDHADTGRRHKTPLPGETARTTYGVALPVLRAVVSALRQRVVAAPLASLVLADRLWRAGSLEERRIAAELLALASPHAPCEAGRLVESWLLDLADADAADVLATVGCAPLLRADPASRLHDARRWLVAERRWSRRFGVMILAALARDKTYHDAAALLDALQVVMADPSPEVRRAVVTTLWHIAPKGHVEVARFLRSQALETEPATRWIVRRGLSGLSEELRNEIESGLKGF